MKEVGKGWVDSRAGDGLWRVCASGCGAGSERVEMEGTCLGEEVEVAKVKKEKEEGIVVTLIHLGNRRLCL